MNHYEYTIGYMLRAELMASFLENFKGKSRITYEECFRAVSGEAATLRLGIEQLSVYSILPFHAYNMYMSGGRTYKISPAIHDMLRLSRPGKLKAKDIMYPHKNFFLEFPIDNTIIVNFNGEDQVASGVYIHIDRDIDTIDYEAVTTYDEAVDPAAATISKHYMEIRGMVASQPKNAEEYGNANFYFFTFKFKHADTTVEDAISSFNYISKLTEGHDDDIRNAKNESQSAEIFSYVISTMMYATSVNKDIERIEKRGDVRKLYESKKYARKNKHKDILEKYVLGRNVKTPTSLTKYIGKDHSFTRFNDKTFAVRGHLRFQKVGKRTSSDHKWIFIEPYIKGEGKVPEKINYEL